ncbi:MAG: YggS family pyridoxal phosphate-dependent enzyme [candidate division NC10 bacterium]|jgi:pyridoxal phosphate enzyme (YggS family)
MTIKERIESVRERIAAAALRVGRDPGEVLVVAVAKTFPVSAVREAVAAGINDVGENRVQEAKAKIAEIDAPCRWHMVGHLQTNKARLAVRLFDWIQSLDSLKLARELETAVSGLGKPVRTLVEVNLAQELSKTGLTETDLFSFLEQAMSLPSLSIEGLMVMPPFDPDPERGRPYFQRLRRLRDEAASRFPQLALTHLSMGMSHDFEVAVEEGATMVRIGTAIFGERPTKQMLAG